MRFFTPEMWLSFQSNSKASKTKPWKQRLKEYEREFEKALPMLNAKTRQFFQRVSLHDGRTKELKLFEKMSRKWTRPGQAELSITDVRGRVHVLAYADISKFVVDFPSENPLFYGEYDGFGDWGYDELTLSKKNLSHEILFASGATILIECATIKLVSSSARKDTR